MHGRFTLGGQTFMAMDSARDHKFTFTPAISFSVDCKTQEEVDELWEKLSEGGAKGQCGWLEDRYGVSWQIVPTVLPGDDAGQGSAAGEAGHDRDAQDDKARHRGAARAGRGTTPPRARGERRRHR